MRANYIATSKANAKDYQAKAYRRLIIATLISPRQRLLSSCNTFQPEHLQPFQPEHWSHLRTYSSISCAHAHLNL